MATVPAAEIPIPNVDKNQVGLKTKEKAEEQAPLPFDPEALKDKYIAERDKRLARGQGVEQYIGLDGHLSHYLKDPWVEPGFEREPVYEEVEVLIIGGGYGGEVVAVRLIEAGVENFRIAKGLYLFQRTPSSIDVRDNKPTDSVWAENLDKGWQKKRMDNFDSVVNGGTEADDMVADGWTDIIRELLSLRIPRDLTSVEAAAERQLVDFKKMKQVRARCDSVVHDKETADALKPWYNQFCKRPCFHDEYLDTFNRPSVHLIHTNGAGVDRITEKGVLANNQEYEIDCLIYATGFDLTTDWTHRTGMEIYGRNNLTITEKWKEGASTLHGWSSRQFPNCFFVSVVQAAITPNFMHVTSEQARHFAYVISECRRRGIRTVEPTQEAEDAWCKTIVDGTKLRADFFKECTPGYYNNEGRPTLVAARNGNYSHGSPAFLKILENWRKAGDLAGLDVRYFR